jgi:hypothetical protein
MLIVGGLATAVNAGEPAGALPALGDLSQYRRAELPPIPTPEIKSPGFEGGAAGWTLPAGYRHAAGEGRSQTGALCYERSNPADYPLAEQQVALLPDTQYRFSVWVKTENVRGEDQSGATVCLQFFGNGKWLGGVYPSGVTGTKDWTLVEGAGTVPAGADSCRLTLYMRRGLTGKAWFDDATVVPINRAAEAHLLRPSQYFLNTDGRFLLSWRLSGNLREANQNATLVTRIEARAEGKTVKPLSFPCRDWSSSGDLGALPAGPLTLIAQLLDPQTKTILHEQEFTASCIDPATIPATAVRIDSQGRTTVGGKPFLPVGLYLHGLDPKTVETIAASPFNCVMPYGSLTLAFKDTTKQSMERTREVLDACAARDLKVIFSIKDVYEGTQYCPKQWHGVTGDAAIATAVVEAFRDHTALLAWYVCDELALNEAPRVAARRQLLHRLDPWHPSWAVYYQYSDLPGYISTADILGVDPYPIGNQSSHDMHHVAATIDSARQALGAGTGGLPLWVVPQAHNTGLYNPAINKDRETLLAKSRAPSEEEMRSMSLLMAIQGARGFVFYSYFDLLKPAVLPDYEQRWKELCNVGGLLRELQPFLYSDETAPAVTVKTIQGAVRAAAYKTADGKVKVLITGNGPGASEAEIAVAGCVNLKARYGKIESLGGGKYRFKGTDICSDVLESL